MIQSSNSLTIPKQSFLGKSKIPKIIWQTWETHNLSPCLNTFVELIKQHNSNYQHFLFDSNQRRSFIKNFFDNSIVEAYDRIIPGGFKADLWRYCILYCYGGFYCDIDMICMNSFDILLKHNVDIIMPIDLNQNSKEGQHNLVNAFIGIPPKHPLMKICIDIIFDNITNETWWNSEKLPLEFSGPGVLGMALNKYLQRNPRESFVGKEGVHNLNNESLLLLNFTNQIEPNTNSNYQGDCVKEFIKIKNGDYILQNRNGNSFVKYLYEKEIKLYNTISWVDMVLNQQKPYLPHSTYNLNTSLSPIPDQNNEHIREILNNANSNIYCLILWPNCKYCEKIIKIYQKYGTFICKKNIMLNDSVLSDICILTSHNPNKNLEYYLTPTRILIFKINPINNKKEMVDTLKNFIIKNKLFNHMRTIIWVL